MTEPDGKTGPAITATHFDRAKLEKLPPHAPEGSVAFIAWCPACNHDLTGDCLIALVPQPDGNQQMMVFQPGRCPYCHVCLFFAQAGGSVIRVPTRGIPQRLA